MNVTSEPGHGANFVVEFPPLEANMSERKTLMVIDDDPDILEALCAVLEDEGYCVVGCGSGQEAFAQLRGKGGGAPVRPTLILLDLRMPEMSGHEFRTQQRLDPALVDIPVILLSADVETPEIAAALAVRGFLRKPVDLTELLRLISALSTEVGI